MKRRLATILVLALLVSVLGGIAVFSSAETATADPIRYVLWGGNKYQYNCKVDGTKDAYDYANGIVQLMPTIAVAADGTLSVKGYSGTTYTSADMDALAAALYNGDFKNSDYTTNNIPALSTTPAGSRYIRFTVKAALEAAAGDTAAIADSIEALLAAYKALGGGLDGVIADGDAEGLDEAVFAAVEEAFSGASTSAYNAFALNAWQDTASGSNTAMAGNTSNFILHSNVAGYSIKGYNKFLGDMLRMRDIYTASNGKVQMTIGIPSYSNSDNPDYYLDAIGHATLLGVDLVMFYEGSSSSQISAARMLQFMNNYIGFSDRETLNLPNSKNDLFVISGATANGKNLFLVTPKDTAAATVTETEDGVVIDMDEQVITFAGGKVIDKKREGEGSINTLGTWIQTDAAVLPLVNSSEDRLLSQKEVLTYHYTFDGAEAGYWTAGQGTTEIAVAPMKDGALNMQETSHIRNWATIGNKITNQPAYKGLYGLSVEFTLPEGGIPAEGSLQVLYGYTGSGKMDSGIVYQDGQLYYSSVNQKNAPMEMYGEIVPGKTYTAKRLFDRTVAGYPILDYFVYDSEGTLIAEATGITGIALYYDSTNFHSVGFLVQDVGANPILVDNFKCFLVKEDITTALSVFDAATGTAIDASTASNKTIGYRLDWMNISAPAKALSLVAGHYDAEGNLVSEEPLANMNMAPGCDGIVTGTVAVKEASVRVYLKQGNAWTTNLTCDDITYGEAVAPKAEAALGEVKYVYATAADGEYTAAVPVNAGTYFVKAVVAGNEEIAPLESAPVSFTIGKAALEITAEDIIITYGEKLTAIDVLPFGFVNDDDLTSLDGELAFDCEYVQFGDVGEYIVTPKGLTSDNYEITFIEGALIVEQKEIGIQWGNLLLPEAATAQKPTATATGTVNGDVLTLVVDGERTEVGSGYVATVIAIEGDKAANYKLPEDVDTTFSIGQAFVLNITNGTPDKANYNVGDTATITAIAAPTGKAFAGWEITGIDTTGLDLTAESISFVISEGSSIVVKALYKDVVFTVTVNGAGEGGTVPTAQYNVGDTVTVNAGTKAGFTFNGWTVNGVTVADTSASSITFVMPEGNVTLTANWVSTNSPTGDSFPVAAIAALAIFSVMGMAVISFRKKAI